MKDNDPQETQPKKKSTWRCSSMLVIREMLIKPQWDATSHLWECLKFKDGPYQVLAEETELSYTAGGNFQTLLKTIWQIFLEVKHTPWLSC